MRPVAAKVFFAFGVAAAAVVATGYAVQATAKGRGDLWREREPTDALVGQVPSLPSLAPLVKQLKPAVVNIYTTQVIRPFARRAPPAPLGSEEDPIQEFWRQFMGQGPEKELRRNSLGSGFIINPKGYVITNNHVIERANEIKVRLSDGREFKGEVVGRDPRTDIALLKLKGEGEAKDLPIAYLGDSDSIQQGDFTIAIGNPFGLDHSVSLGIVSAKERVIGAGPYDDFIQTDASINPGNSGGPLFSLRGDVVGVNTAIVGQGIGFSVPINLVKEILPPLESKGIVTRGWLGVHIQEVTPDLARSFKLDRHAGALVDEVYSNTPAEKAGLKEGDVIVMVNGRPVESPNQLLRAVALVEPGQTANLTVIRDGKERRLSVAVGERPNEGDLATLRTGKPLVGKSSADKLGIAVAPLTPEFARAHNLTRRDGLVVAHVDDDSPGAAAGVGEGNLILEVNRRPVRTVADYVKAVEAARPGDLVLLRLQRDNSSVYVAVRVPG